MKKYKSLVVYGCSLTKDNYIDTWADYTSQELKLPLVNNAERGAGYEFISDRIIHTINDIKDSLCIIMWPSADRWDLWVNDATPQLQDDIEYASWLNGKNPDFCDLDGNYNKKRGYYINGAVPRGLKHLYYKYFYTQEYHINHALKTIVMVQNLLKNNGIDFVMGATHPLSSLIQYHDDGIGTLNDKIYQHLNLKLFLDNSEKKGFITHSKEQQFAWYNTHYPTSEAHEWFSDNIVLPKIYELYGENNNES